MRTEDILFDLKQMTKNHPEGIPLFNFKNVEFRKYRMTNNQWSWIMRSLVGSRKIEVFDFDMKIRPTEGIDRNVNYEVRITEGLIKDIVSEISPCKPSEAYRHCIMKYGYCNPESFTRLMRKLGEDGIIHRDENDYYSITNNSSQVRLNEAIV